MHSCCKRYPGVPFIHRVFLRDGSASHVHGHVWTFEFEFAADRLDVNGFVVDFTGLTALEESLNKLKDALVLSDFDPRIEHLRACPDIFSSLVVVPDASSEGLAAYFFGLANRLCGGERGVRCVRCTVIENENNSATFAGG